MNIYLTTLFVLILDITTTATKKECKYYNIIISFHPTQHSVMSTVHWAASTIPPDSVSTTFLYMCLDYICLHRLRPRRLRSKAAVSTSVPPQS